MKSTNQRALKYVSATVPFGDLPLTIGSNGYLDVRNYIPSGISPIAAAIADFGNMKGVVGITANGRYLYGANSEISGKCTFLYYYL